MRKTTYQLFLLFLNKIYLHGRCCFTPATLPIQHNQCNTLQYAAINAIEQMTGMLCSVTLRCCRLQVPISYLTFLELHRIVLPTVPGLGFFPSCGRLSVSFTLAIGGVRSSRDAPSLRTCATVHRYWHVAFRVVPDVPSPR